MTDKERKSKERLYDALERQIAHRVDRIDKDRAHLANRKAEAEASGDVKKIAYWAGYYPERMRVLSDRERRTVGPLRAKYTELFKELYDTDE